MSLKELKKFSDEQLNNEVRRREKERRGKVLGYRAIHFGDDYCYGGYTDYPREGDALASVSNSKNGGRVEEIYKDTPKPGKIH